MNPVTVMGMKTVWCIYSKRGDGMTLRVTTLVFSDGFVKDDLFFFGTRSNDSTMGDNKNICIENNKTC